MLLLVLLCRDKDLEQLLATIRQLEDKVKKHLLYLYAAHTHRYRIMTFNFEVFTSLNVFIKIKTKTRATVQHYMTEIEILKLVIETGI